MKKLASLILAIAICAVGYSQEDKSKEILDKLSEKAKSFETITAKFEKTYTKEDRKSTSKGSILTKGTKFFLETGEGQNLYSDGRTVWTHVIEDAEVYKCPVNEVLDGEDFSDPNELFTIWEKNFKTRYLKELEVGEKKLHVINLHPTDPKDRKFHTITLQINSETMEVEYFIIKGKDGSKTVYHITQFETNKAIDDSKFVWQNKPDVDIIDC